MSEEVAKVNVIFFKGPHCAACHIVAPIISSIVESSRGSATLTVVDTEEEKELTEKYGISTIPVVLYNEKVVLSAEAAGELIQGEISGMMGGDMGGMGGSFDMQPSDGLGGMGGFGDAAGGLGDSDPALAALNFDTVASAGSQANMFSSAQSGLFNHLFNELISSSIDSNAETVEQYQKFNMLAISQKTMTPEAIQQLTRPSLGDYVHIGVLQSIVTSILAINPRSHEYLFKVGQSMGKFGNVQFRFLRHYPRIFESPDLASKFRDLLEGLQELYSANSLGLPLYLASKSLVEPLTKKKARLTVYDSAFCAQMSPIGQPVCFLIAGEIAGLIETTLGEYNVSVVEKRCFGLGDPYCQFEIELGKPMDFSFVAERPFLSKVEKERFQTSLDTISENMYKSSLIRTILRPGISDHVHISVLQQALNGLKFSDPFFSTLLYYAGLHYGRHGADVEILFRVLKERLGDDLPEDTDDIQLEFEDGLRALVDYFNDPATILTRAQGTVDLLFEDEETALVRIHESAISSGLSMMGTDFIIESDEEKVTLCDYTAGFIQGRLSRILEDDVQVEEVTCQSLGSAYCEFRVVLD